MTLDILAFKLGERTEKVGLGPNKIQQKYIPFRLPKNGHLEQDKTVFWIEMLFELLEQ